MKLFLEDLQLYSGNIREIKDLHGPDEDGFGGFRGIIRTALDEFNFTALPMFCDEASWTVAIADPVACLRNGHRCFTFLSFPKLHQNPDLRKRYRIANKIYAIYNRGSASPEDNRIPKWEAELGYERLSSCSEILAAIIKDFRSYPQKKNEKRRKKS